MQNVDEWRVETDEHAECWICNKSQLIVILWNKMIGDKGIQEMEQFTKMIDTDHFKAPAEDIKSSEGD